MFYLPSLTSALKTISTRVTNSSKILFRYIKNFAEACLLKLFSLSKNNIC